jgi:hypothetical protein
MQHPTNKTITTNLPDPSLQGFHNFLRPCQLRFIHDPSRERIVRKSRQIGIFPTAAYDLVHEASRAVNPSDARVSSREGRQAQLSRQDSAHLRSSHELPGKVRPQPRQNIGGSRNVVFRYGRRNESPS